MRDSYADGREKFSVALLFELFAVFFKIGLFTFGGGLAMLPLLTEELSIKLQYPDKHSLPQYYYHEKTFPQQRFAQFRPLHNKRLFHL